MNEIKCRECHFKEMLLAVSKAEENCEGNHFRLRHFFYFRSYPLSDLINEPHLNCNEFEHQNRRTEKLHYKKIISFCFCLI